MPRPGVADIHKGYYTFKVNYQMLMVPLIIKKKEDKTSQGLQGLK